MLNITSPAFEKGGTIPEKYTCYGENINPPLVVENVPEKAQSLVLIVDDPDAPMGTWDHWLLWNIKPETRLVDENSTPEDAVSGSNTSGKLGYEGPCPPDGTHRYFFKLYALDIPVSAETLPQGAKRNKLEDLMKGHILEKAELMGKVSSKE